MTDLDYQHHTGASMGVTHNELKAMCEAGPAPVTLACSVVGRRVKQSINVARRREYLSVSVHDPDAEHRNVPLNLSTPLDWGIFQSYNNLIKS